MKYQITREAYEAHRKMAIKIGKNQTDEEPVFTKLMPYDAGMLTPADIENEETRKFIVTHIEELLPALIFFTEKDDEGNYIFMPDVSTDQETSREKLKDILNEYVEVL